MKKLIILLIFIPNIIYANTTFNEFAMRVESWAEGLNGYIVSAGKDITIDLGKDANVVKGMEFTVLQDGEELLHPITGKSLGKKKVETGSIIINRVEAKYSVCSAKDNKGIKKGDSIKHIFPVPVNIETDKMEDNEVAQLKYALLKKSVLKEDTASNYKILCSREKLGANIAKCNLSYNGQEIFYNDISVKGVKIIKTADNTGDIKPIKINTTAHGITLGYLFGKENNVLVAINEKNSISIYQIENDNLIEKATINSISENIVNVEALDLNSNGKDELFISAVTKKGKPSSYIFEYNNGKFTLLQKDIPYFFRTYYASGSKHLICQQYTAGAMTGMIYNVEYEKDNNMYTFTSPYSRSYGASIYGFAMVKNSENEPEEIVFFNRHGQLSLTDKDKIKTYKNVDYGNTPNYIEYAEKLETGVNVAATGESAGFFVYDEQSIIVPVYQRIVQQEDGSIMLYSNKLVKANVVGKYKLGTIGTYYLTNDIVPVWEKKVDGNTVTDIDTSSDGKYLAYIVSKNKTGLSKSYIYMIEK